MSSQVINVSKCKSAGSKGLQIHNQREKESRTNPDIQKDKSNLNYDLHNSDPIDYNKKIKERIGELRLDKAVRKDAVVMSNVLISSDKAFFKGLSPDRELQYFKDCYSFLSARYGSQNVISAVVHKDESTPHMHFNFVPVTSDGRLSAKSIFDKKELNSLHDDLFNAVGKRYGLERGKGITNERGHLKEQEFKLQAEKKRISDELKEIEEYKKEIEPVFNSLNDFEKRIKSTKIKRDKFGFGSGVIIPKKEYTDLVDMALHGLFRINVETKNNELSEKNKSLLSKNALLSKQNIDLTSDNTLLRQENNKLKDFILSNNLQEHVLRHEQAKEQAKIAKKLNNRGYSI